MRHVQWLIAAAFIIVVAAVGSVYYARLTSAPKAASAVQPLPSGIEATAKGWVFSKNSGECPQVEVHARAFRQIKDPSTFELEGVDVKLFRECGKEYNHVTSEKAQFDTVSGVMFSEGEAHITLGIPAGQAESDRFVQVVSSGVKFETKTGVAATDRETSFRSPKGDGTCKGAEYDPNKRELKMNSAVELHLKPKTPKSKPLKIEAGSLVYFEKESKVVLFPSAKLTREGLVLNTEMSVVFIENKKLQRVESVKPWGVETEPGKRVEYQADNGVITFTPDGQVSSLKAEHNAHLISTSDVARTDVRSDALEMDFAPTGKESHLTRALATGHAVVDSNPVTKPGVQPSESKILKADAVEMRMKPGGKEIDTAETTGASTLEFMPNRAGQLHRTVTGEKMWVVYGANNQVQNFRTVKAATRTDNPPKDKKPQPPTITSSQELRAELDPKTHQISRLEQTLNFRYQEGDRKAQADRATLEQASNLMTLAGNARMADPTGSASADQIVINQKSGDFTAEGHVASTRLPDKKGETGSAMLNQNEPIQAKANRMTSSNNNLLVRYEGNAVAWQGANRIQADKLEIDRDEGVLKANGSVVTQLVDKGKKDKNGKPLPQQTAVFTIVRAPEMTYTEQERTAVYKGGVVLNRANLNVKSHELTAFLKDQDADSSLDKAYADGAVNIVQTTPGRVRTGTSEHAEFYADEEKIILEKGDPKFVDSLKGTTQARKLTYYTNDDRLVEEGTAKKPAESLLRRKKS